MRLPTVTGGSSGTAIQGELIESLSCRILLTCAVYSVTALKANFWHAAESLQGQELKL